MKLQLKTLTLNGRSADEKRINSVIPDFFTFIFQFLASPENPVILEKTVDGCLRKSFDLFKYN